MQGSIIGVILLDTDSLAKWPFRGNAVLSRGGSRGRAIRAKAPPF